MVNWALSGVQMRPRTNSGNSLSRFSVAPQTRPLEEAYKVGQKPVVTDMIENVLAKDY